MREIKFRVFDKKNKKMLEVDILFINEKMFRPVDGSEYDVWNYDTEYFSNPLQHTGLKDKNGIEIYEGDILKYPYVRSSSVNYTIEIGVIEWSDEYCGFIIDEVQNIGGFCGIESKHINEIEVIGNIYENPEFIKEGI